MSKTIEFSGRKIGSGHPCFLIAEVGTTSIGDIDRALALVDASAEVGADAVKFQVIDPDQISDPAAATAKMRVNGEFRDVSMAEMFARLHFEPAAWRRIADRARERNILFFATVDYIAGVDMLDELGVAFHKIGAWDATFWPLIDRIGRSKKPLMVDLGPATAEEIEQIERWYSAAGGPGPIMYLHDYHTSIPAEMNMRAIDWLAARGKGPVGFSSPNRESDVDLIAVALGAQMIEKRLTLDAGDAAFHAHESLTPAELGEWVRRIRNAEASLGKAEIRPSRKDLEDKDRFYRSLCTLKDIPAGAAFTPENLGGKRPGKGLTTQRLPKIWGAKAAKSLKMNTLISDADIGK